MFYFSIGKDSLSSLSINAKDDGLIWFELVKLRQMKRNRSQKNRCFFHRVLTTTFSCSFFLLTG